MAGGTQVSSNTNSQLFAGGGGVQPVFGMGARGFGAAGGATRGRKAHIQFREQNSGMRPAEDYRGAKFLPGLWADLDRNGCPMVMQGGTVVGLASVENAAGTDSGHYVHMTMPANAGIRQRLLYTTLLDAQVAISLDSLFPAGVFTPSAATTVVTGAASTNFVSGNKPLAYNPTNSNSTAWEDVYANQKFEGQMEMSTQWLAMYPISDVFMHGVTLDVNPTFKTVDGLGLGVEGARRTDFGFNDVRIGGAADIVLTGIRPGDYVMPNPYLPGKLISVKDFVTLAMGDTLGSINLGDTSGASTGLSGMIETAMGSDALTRAEATAYAMEHIVGRCFKRQPRATSNGTTLTGHDIYASTYKFQTTVPGLGLSGSQSQGIEADQEAARNFAHALAPTVGGTATLDVVFINFNIK